jgi:hypothetical protein
LRDITRNIRIPIRRLTIGQPWHLSKSCQSSRRKLEERQRIVRRGREVVDLKRVDQVGRLSFFKNSANRGSPCKFFRKGSTFNESPIRPLSR